MANGDIRSFVSLRSVWLRELVGSLSTVLTGVDEGLGVAVVEDNVVGNSVCVGTS